ncbi:glucan synthase-like 4 [Actinidia rufa]|uniref:Glucan synthase-like 4 n=1 Tax=Actinidia rufa TaxID=165716 RepID=A0A7J0FGC2_9ERIC|nr:glucan synthase-like 4 [Actinidia rufa]
MKDLSASQGCKEAHTWAGDIAEAIAIQSISCLRCPIYHNHSVVVEIWASNQQSILLGLLGTGPRMLKGRPAQTNKSKGPGRGRSKPLRRRDQTKAMTADGVMSRVHGSRRDPRKDEYGKISRRDIGDIIGKIAIWRVSCNCWCREGENLARGRGGGNTLTLGDLTSTLRVALVSSMEMTWRDSVDSFYLGQEGSEIKFGVLNAEMGLRRMEVWRCSVPLRARMGIDIGCTICEAEERENTDLWEFTSLCSSL